MSGIILDPLGSRLFLFLHVTFRCNLRITCHHTVYTCSSRERGQRELCESCPCRQNLRYLPPHLREPEVASRILAAYCWQLYSCRKSTSSASSLLIAGAQPRTIPVRLLTCASRCKDIFTGRFLKYNNLKHSATILRGQTYATMHISELR